LVIDPIRRQFYWQGALDDDWGIYRADYDGRNNVKLVDTLSSYGSRGLAVDFQASRMYWYDDGSIWRGDLDGGNVIEFVANAGFVNSLVLAPVPEPGTWALVAGAAGVLVIARRRGDSLRGRGPA
jgi:hypothetical protein